MTTNAPEQEVKRLTAQAQRQRSALVSKLAPWRDKARRLDAATSLVREHRTLIGFCTGVVAGLLVVFKPGLLSLPLRQVPRLLRHRLHPRR